MGKKAFLSEVRELWRAAVAPQARPDELFKLVRERHFPDARRLLAAAPELWFASEDGNTLLHWASLGGWQDLVSGALTAGVHVDVRSQQQQTPLMWAVFGGHVEVAYMLLTASADLMAQDAKGATPVIIAVQHKQRAALQLLINQDHGKSLEKTDANGCSAAHWAAFEGDLVSLELLDAAGLSFRNGDIRGSLPLHCAVSAHQMAVIGFLVERGSSPTAQDAEGLDCLDIAEKIRNTQMQEELLAAMLRRLSRHRASSGGSLSNSSLASLTASQPGAGDVAAVGRSPAAREDAAAWRDPRKSTALPPLGIGALALFHCAASPESPAGTGGAADAGAGGVSVDSTAVPTSSIQSCLGVCFHLAYAESWDVLFSTLVGNLGEACVSGMEPGAIAFVVTDRYEKVVDISSPSTVFPSLDRFPLRVQIVGAVDAALESRLGWKTSLATPWTARTAASPDFFKRRALIRTPAFFRWEAWKCMLRLNDRNVPQGRDYNELSAMQSEWSQLIDVDVNRTFRVFNDEEQARLRRILNAYAAFAPEVGYCQGMNLIAGVLLLVSGCNEEETFGVFVCLMGDIGLSGFYREGFPLLCHYLRICSRLLSDADPELSRHLATAGSADGCAEKADCTMYVQQWFLTLFVDCMPLSMVVIIWDAIFCEGLHVILKVALALLRGLRGELLSMHLHDIVRFLKSMRSYSDEDSDLKAFDVGLQLLRAAQQITLPEISAEERLTT